MYHGSSTELRRRDLCCRKMTNEIRHDRLETDEMGEHYYTIKNIKISFTSLKQRKTLTEQEAKEEKEHT